MFQKRVYLYSQTCAHALSLVPSQLSQSDRQPRAVALGAKSLAITEVLSKGDGGIPPLRCTCRSLGTVLRRL